MRGVERVRSALRMGVRAAEVPHPCAIRLRMDGPPEICGCAARQEVFHSLKKFEGKCIATPF